MVTTAGFNALLKIVEEPPEHLIFISATTEPEKVLLTIRSRTHHYRSAAAAAHYAGVARATCGAGGRRRRRCGTRWWSGPARFPTISVLDQRAGWGRDTHVTHTRALGLLGVTDVALIDDAVDALPLRCGRIVRGDR